MLHAMSCIETGDIGNPREPNVLIIQVALSVISELRLYKSYGNC